jgi:hypothetical protein
VREPRSPLHLADDRIKGAICMLWRTEVTQARMRFSGEAFQERAVSRDLPIPV